MIIIKEKVTRKNIEFIHLQCANNQGQLNARQQYKLPELVLVAVLLYMVQGDIACPPVLCLEDIEQDIEAERVATVLKPAGVPKGLAWNRYSCFVDAEPPSLEKKKTFQYQLRLLLNHINLKGEWSENMIFLGWF